MTETAPERIWLATSLKAAITDLESIGSMSDLSVKPVQSSAHAYREWVPADLLDDAVAELESCCAELASLGYEPGNIIFDDIKDTLAKLRSHP